MSDYLDSDRVCGPIGHARRHLLPRLRADHHSRNNGSAGDFARNGKYDGLAMYNK